MLTSEMKNDIDSLCQTHGIDIYQLHAVCLGLVLQANAEDNGETFASHVSSMVENFCDDNSEAVEGLVDEYHAAYTAVTGLELKDYEGDDE